MVFEGRKGDKESKRAKKKINAQNDNYLVE
jgi:hypothetical protein